MVHFDYNQLYDHQKTQEAALAEETPHEKIIADLREQVFDHLQSQHCSVWGRAWAITESSKDFIAAREWLLRQIIEVLGIEEHES